MNAPSPTLAQEFDAALEWWRMAGVDCDFADDATVWLGDGASDADLAKQSKPNRPSSQTASAPTGDHHKRNTAPAKPAVERVDLLGSNPPQDLASFREWWLSAPGLDAIGPRGRVAPRGSRNPELMVITIDPEQSDTDTLLSGPQGRLMSRIIAAMGLDEETVYFASALPRHTPMADTAALAASGMDQITAFHINLVSPQRLLAFGSGIPPLLGHALTNDASHLREINQKSRSVPLLVSEGLDSLMAMPRLKTRFWRRWIEWSAKE